MSASFTSSATVRVRLENLPRWVQLELSLNGDWDGGRIIDRDSHVTNLEPADERSRGYDLGTWETGIASGAFYAYRTLGLPRRRVFVSDLQGSLGSEDMTALAGATALGVAKLLGGEVPCTDISGWNISVSMAGDSDRRRDHES